MYEVVDQCQGKYNEDIERLAWKQLFKAQEFSKANAAVDDDEIIPVDVDGNDTKDDVETEAEGTK